MELTFFSPVNILRAISLSRLVGTWTAAREILGTSIVARLERLFGSGIALNTSHSFT